MARLRRVDVSSPGIRREKHGDELEYFEESGVPVTDPEVLARIAELVIPPAWKDVWISPYPMGHIQATGMDAKGRKQYLYHQQWRERRDQAKFDDMVAFARALPAMRARVDEHLDVGPDQTASRTLARERVLACAVRLLDRGFFRVGGESYAAENETYGLATMHKKHVRLEDGAIEFDYIAKSGKRRIQTVVDPEVYDIIGRLKRRRGGNPELLAYKRGRQWVDLKSADINEYLKEAAGGDFSAKDFRTWNATLLAAQALAVSAPAAKGSASTRKRAITRAVKEVSHYLGNTPAVARTSYIDPRVFDRFNAGLTVSGALTETGGAGDVASIHGPMEKAVLDLITEHESWAVEPVEAVEGLALAS